MILANINIGTGPSAGDGDPLRTAFNTINNNFANIESNVNALSNSVTSVAGRQGNVILTTQDIVGINNYATISYVNSQLANAGAANISSLESNVASLQADVNTLYGNAGIQSSTLATLTSNAATQAGSLATLTSNAASQAGELSTLLANAVTQTGEIVSLLANAGSQHEAISSLQSNVSTLFANAGAQAGSITTLTSNAAVQAGLIADTNTAITTANTAMKGYVDGQVSTLTSNAAVQAGLIADIKNGVATFGNLIPSANVTYSLGSPTNWWKDLFLSGNTIHIGGATLSVSGGAIQSSLPIAANLTATNITVQGTRIEFASGGYIEEAEVLDGNASPLGYYAVALNSSDDGLISMNALDSNAVATSSVIVSNVSVQLNVANSTPSGNPLVWNFDQSSRIILPNGGVISNDSDNIELQSANDVSVEAQGVFNVYTDTAGTTKQWQFGDSGDLSVPGDVQFADGSFITDNLEATGDFGISTAANVGFIVETNDGSHTWTYGIDGNLTFPDSTVQTTAWTGTVAYGNTIAIGYQTGNTSQGNNAVAIGSTAGKTSQGAKAISIGEVAGRLNQGIESVGLGAGAGEQNQGAYAIAIGSTTAYLNQGVGAVAIGTSAGALYQGEHAIAIGTGAGNGLQGNNSIILNATGSMLDQTTDDTFTVKPIRAASAGNVLYYNTSSGEITYSTISGDSVSGNVAEATVAYAVNISPVLLNQEYPMAFLPSSSGTWGVKSSDGTVGFTFNPNKNRMIVGNIQLAADGNIRFADGTTQITAANYGNTQVASYLPTYTGNISAGNIFANGTSGKIGYSNGGYVVQSGNSSGVSLNTISGNIQLDTVNIAASSAHTVALSNNKLDANDIILVQAQDTTGIDLHIGAYYFSTNTAIIYLRNVSGSSIGPITPKLKFIIVKAPSA